MLTFLELVRDDELSKVCVSSDEMFRDEKVGATCSEAVLNRLPFYRFL